MTRSLGLQTKGLNKSYLGSSQLFKDFDFTVNESEFCVILGPSGCGKSTLLRLLSGIETPDSGSVFKNLNPNDHQGFVFQDASLLAWRTVLENTLLPAELSGNSKDLKPRSLEILKQLGLENATDLYPRELSGGMKMRVSIARALILNPKLLFLDEPFSALDENTRFQLQEILYSLWLEYKPTIVLVTHSVQEAVFLSTRIVQLNSTPVKISRDLTNPLPKNRTANTRKSIQYFETINSI